MDKATAESPAGSQHVALSAPHTSEIAICIRNVSKMFGDFTALESIDLDIYEGEFLSLLGPSGCGKTTLLRIIAGFEEPSTGEVFIAGEDALRYPAYQRPVNTVFQSYALFPHMTVLQNIMFGLKMAGTSKAEAEARALTTMRTVEIEAFANRKPQQLSGGQRQRVALARAIVNEPKVLLLDEPLSALDLKLRKQLQVELMQLQRRLGITFIYVTHDQEEALVMSDRVAVMRTGVIEQLGAAEDIYERPRNRYVATFLGSANLFEGVVESVQDTTLQVRTAHGLMTGTTQDKPQHIASLKDNVLMAIRPEKMFIASSDRAGAFDNANSLEGVIEEIVYTGVDNQYRVRVGEQLLQVYTMNKGVLEHDAFDIGDHVMLVLPINSMLVLEPDPS